MKGMRPLEKAEWTLVFHSVRGANRLRTKALMIILRKTGFRVSEVLSLRVRDLIFDGRVATYVTVARKQRKGGKKKETTVTSRTMKLHLDTHPHILAQYDDLKSRGYFRSDDFFFQSRAKGNKAIDRIQAWRDFIEPIRRRRIEGRVGTHGIGRKTFAKEKLDHLKDKWEPGKEIPVQTLQRCTGHRTLDALMSYIEFADDDVEDAIMNS